jgi:ABC-type proline/glycine betaine transport system permease subunit
MSLRSIPLLVIAFILYNAIVFAFGTEALASLAFPEIHMLSGGVWRFTWGDFIILITLFLLFAELIKATYTNTSSLVDHGLSMIVFILCIVEFLLAPQAATSTFFLVMVATAIDVVAGFTIGIRVARRDLSIGGAGGD